MNKVLNISKATKKNWEKLNVTEEEIAQKLSKRANKLYSEKHIIPNEYFSDKSNISMVKHLLRIIYSCNLSIEDVMYNLGINLLKSHQLVKIADNKVISDNMHISKILTNIKTLNPELLNFELPKNETDILGIIYQSLMSEGNKNKKGSYYTPPKIIKYFLPLINDETVLYDPCCGTGSFILNLGEKIKNPNNIYGTDIDKISCFIAKVNMIIKFKGIDFEPQIYNTDFLEEELLEKFQNKKINLIATNPPWGTKYEKDYSSNFKEISSKEIYSYFIVQSEKLLSNDGKCCMVLPESILNIDVHNDIRTFILKNFGIEEIKLWGKAFKGVLSDIISIKLSKENIEKIKIKDKNSVKTIDKSAYLSNKNHLFSLTDNGNVEIMDYIYSQPYETLKDSLWGLGIVTGNNEKHIKAKFKNGEKIYKGKNIKPYLIGDTEEYIDYKREYFQQVAPDEIYRATEKLVYKFISKKLVFACDNRQRLFLNSANILIPNVETHTTKTVMAFLNSKVLNFIYKHKFNALKIIKGNLLQLPFPRLTKEEQIDIENNIELYLKTRDKETLNNIENLIFKAYNIPQNYIDIIQKE